MIARASVLLMLGLQVLAVLGASTTHKATTKPATTPAPGGIDCTDYLVDQCSHPSKDTPQVEVIHNVTMNNCQFFCNDIYGANCTFFIADQRQNICDIWTIKPEDYEKDCVKHEGPVGKDKDLDKCKNNVKDCNAFREGYCMFEGNLLEHLNSIKDEETCQLACQHVPSCKYYIYDNKQNDCQLLDSDSRQCDLVKGIKGATKDYDTECKGK